MMKSSDARIEPWGTPVVIGSVSDFTPFIPTICVCLFHKDVELHHLCRNGLMFKVKWCDQDRMFSRDL